MKLSALLRSAGIQTQLSADPEVRAVVSDSRKARKDALFVALGGATVDGASFASAAVQAGASAVVSERALGLEVPQVIVPDARAALGAIASAFSGHPSRRLRVLAITGTNGKTTVAHLVAQLLRHAGHKVATIGTLGLVTAEGRRAGTLTTPECVELHETLAQLAAEGHTHVAIEASSHALDQQRLAGVAVAAAAWTNLSHDHLDYHGEMGAYAAAKLRLFKERLVPGGAGFVNADDPACATALDDPRVIGWSHGGADAAVQVAGARANASGVSFTLHAPGTAPLQLSAPLLGRFNVDNLTAATLLCRSEGLDDAVLLEGCRALQAPPGRLQVVPSDIGSLVLVDYAHTPDALRRALQEARSLSSGDGRILCVFGCGGDRDQAKRGPMGEIAAHGADLAVVTSDNPRTEDPDAIIAAVADGLARGGAFELDRLAPSRIAAVGKHHAFLREPDRAMAIRRAVGNLQPGDVLLIAGKGHERTQDIGGASRPFDDVEVAAGWLARHRRSGSGMKLQPSGAGPRAFSFSGADALRACGGQLLVHGRGTTSLCTDTRSIVDDCAFVALKGERFDANEFIGQALDGGAAGVICATGNGRPHISTAQAARAWLLEHDDTLVALGDLARAHRRAFAEPVVGITGSNGKTTTKELTALALGAAGPVLATRANHNNRIGVPLTLARLRAGQRFAVVEMGTSERGEIAELARIGEPDVGVITNIGEAHLEGLGGLPGVAAEKVALLVAIPANGTAILPAGEALLAPHLHQIRARQLTFGRHPDADVRLVSDIAVDGLQQRFSVSVCGDIVDVRMRGIGVHLADNAMAALAVARSLDVNLRAAAAMLQGYEPVGQRMKPSRIGRLLALEDCYNANPRSCQAALATLATLPGPRVAVLGDMLELGPDAAALHRQVGRFAVEQGVALVLATGTHAQDYAAGAVEAGGAAQTSADIGQLAAWALNAAGTAGTVLVKGSRGARMERVLEAMRENAGEFGILEVTGVSLAL